MGREASNIQTVVFQKSYDVHDEMANDRGAFDLKNDNSEYASRLFKKHLMLTLNDFLGLAADRIASKPDMIRTSWPW